MRRRISVAMAAWRGERWIGMQLDSLMRQSRRPDEVVICDDSRDDATENEVRRFPCDPGWIRYVRNESRLGIARNFEKALGLCSGELLFLSDQDDVWDTDKVSVLAETLENDHLCDLVFCNSRVVDDNLRGEGYTAWDLHGFDPPTAEMSGEKLCAGILIRPAAYAHDMAFRRDVLDWCLPFPAEPAGACHDFWLASLAAARGRIRAVPRCLTSYRRHDRNFTETGRGSCFSRLKQLSDDGRGETRRSAARYGALNSRLDHVPGTLPELRRLCGDLAVFYRMRADGKLPPPSDYRRFGLGWKSLCRDLLLTRLTHGDNR